MRVATVGGGTLVLAASATTVTALADATPTGIELGLRSGYSIPLGNSQGAAGGATAPSLSDTVNGMVPIRVDAGYRFNENMFVGANFQYGIALVNTDKNQECKQSGESCTANDLMFGFDFHYHLMPEEHFDPWGGIGIGYEILNVDESAGGLSNGVSRNGFQFVNLQVAADYKARPNLGIGPFVMFSLGQFSHCSSTFMGMSTPNCTIPNQALHEWFTIGIRGAYDINVGG